MTYRVALATAAALALLAACDQKPPAAPAPAASASPSAAAEPVGAVLSTKPEITAEDFAARTKELADDKYEGRGAGTPAGEASAKWIASEMKRIGLEPGANGDYFQKVEMVAQTVDPKKSTLTVNANGKDISLSLGKDAVYISKRQKIGQDETVTIKDSDLVFVGYGVKADNEKWNDFAGTDVKGKTIVMFVNDPGFITGDKTLFKGKAMTYFGRWTYKFEEAAAQGAEAALIIHETEPAAYGWNVVEESWTGEQADLVRADAGASRAKLEGWITLDRAKELFTAAGLDIDKMRAAANKRGFKAVPMKGLKLSATISQTITKKTSVNVAGTIKGASKPDEHVIITAHWDHLGNKHLPAGQDGISNGAVDNATGVAGMLEIAEKIKAGPAPARSTTFIAVTLEESGLLGSAYFAEYPFIPLNKIVAGINIDAMQPIGRTKDVLVIGYGASELEDLLKAALVKQKRIVKPDNEPEKGYFYRSDHISLAKKGVPMLYADGGVDKIDGGEAAGKKLADDYREHRYHQPSDQFDPSWDMSGVVEDLTALDEVVETIAKSDKWPTWYKGNEFEAARKASLAGK